MDPHLLNRLISFRHQLHQHPQTSFNEHETRKRIIHFLSTLSITQHHSYPPTALTVDLRGTLPPSGRPYCVAFRADMDALSMTENNPHLPYHSIYPSAAHMCGHDGHVTCLLAFTSIFLPHLSQLPSNKCIRLLFQPSQEGPQSGAKLMIEQGCLNGVDEVYGFHQWPSAPIGQLWCKGGPVMSEITCLKIKITGTGGHASQPQALKVSLWAAIDFYTRLKTHVDLLMQKRSFVCTLPVFQTGERYNVVSPITLIEGSIRSFEDGLAEELCKHIDHMLQEYREKGFVCEFKYHTNAPINNNSEKEANHVLRVGAEVFGAQNVGAGKLPFKASEDFAFFTKEKPGAFFFLSSAKAMPQPFIHSNTFDFNDDLIEKAAIFWLKLALDRLTPSE